MPDDPLIRNAALPREGSEMTQDEARTCVERAFAEFIQRDAFLPPGWNPMPMLTAMKDAICAELTSARVVASPPAPPDELQQWLNAEWSVAPKNGERFAMGQNDRNGWIQNAYTTGARDVIDRLSKLLQAGVSGIAAPPEPKE